MDAQIRPIVSSVEVRRGSYTFAWVLLVVAVGVAAVGAYLGWAKRWPWYDEVVHVLSFFAITLVAALYLYGDALTGYLRHKILLVLTVLCLAVTMGVAWEWGELAYDRMTGGENAILGKFDTLLDLVMDGIGGVIAGVVMLVLLRRRDTVVGDDVRSAA